jgi:predicted acylesterase/phospholipase RssA
MNRYGLALSGGGFRASLYHLGVIRYLRDAGLIQNVNQITSVSGGSVVAAHMVLNWDRYCGSDEEFDQVSGDLIRFLQMDVRNRIVRRFPLASMVNWGRRTVRLQAWRQYTRAGLLEQHYQKFLYGDVGLFSLPDTPRLYILSTDLSEGSLCAFHRDGLLLHRRTASGHDEFEKQQIGLATVAMAVAASSAFPGFFPPLELRGSDVGALEGEFSRHAFTDGGIYDNLGLRMFRHLQSSALRETAEFGERDILNRTAILGVLRNAAGHSDETPLGRLWKILSRNQGTSDSSSPSDENVIAAFNNIGSVLKTEELHRDPVFQRVSLLDEGAQSLLHEYSDSPDPMEGTDAIWLNRQLISRVLEQEAGRPCLRTSTDRIDGILVSNAGASFKVRADGRAGGLMSTAMRATDILMDRVYQLEMNSFERSSGSLFIPITQIVTQGQDPYAPHPEIQRQAALIRTDMDRFTDLEVSTLVQHGYCVARQRCCNVEGLVSTPESTGKPWNPIEVQAKGSRRQSGETVSLSDESTALATAQWLKKSASRHVFSTLLAIKDWPTYIWAPLFLALVFTLPYMLYRSKEIAAQQGYVLEAVTRTSPLYKKILELLDSEPVHEIADVTYQEVETLQEPSILGVEVISDNRIFDLRDWGATTDAQEWQPYSYSRIRMRRIADSPENDQLGFHLATIDENLQYRCRTPSLIPEFYRSKAETGKYHWGVRFDMTSIPLSVETVGVFETMLPRDMAEVVENQGRFRFTIVNDTGLAQIWILMPSGRPYEQFQIWSYPIGQPELIEMVVPATTVDLPIGSIATFQLINPKSNRQYECRWNWTDVSLPE